MTQLSEMLEFIENRIDPGFIRNTREQLKKVLNYEPADPYPLRVQFPYQSFKGYPYSEAFYDMEKMMVNELLGACRTVDVRDATLPMIRANYGVGILPSLFGLKCRILDNNLPWVDHVSSIEEVKKIISKGIPDIRSGLGSRVFETHHFYHEKLSAYPKCREEVRIFHSDLQGPFDVAHLIWGPDIYYALYDEPEIVHALLDLVTETYIVFMREIKKTINGDDDGFNYHWGTLYKGAVVLRNDSAVNLSPEMYEEFIRPYDERIFEAFGSGSMHYCGRADHWVFKMLECKGLKGLNFGIVPNVEYGVEFLRKVYGKAKSEGVAIVGYGLKLEEYNQSTMSEFPTGVTLFVDTDTREEAEALLK